MQRRWIMGVAVCVALAGASTGAALAASAAAPKQASVQAVQKVQFKINRFVKDSLRWNKDVFHVRSGGTITVVNKADDGPHTFSVVKKRDLPTTTKQINECKICQTIGQQVGADPNSDAPPAHMWAEDGVGQDAPANFDKPGDTAFVDGKPGTKVTFSITATKGTTLNFMCAVHPWMQAKVIVG